MNSNEENNNINNDNNGNNFQQMIMNKANEINNPFNQQIELNDQIQQFNSAIKNNTQQDTNDTSPFKISEMEQNDSMLNFNSNNNNQNVNNNPFTISENNLNNDTQPVQSQNDLNNYDTSTNMYSTPFENNDDLSHGEDYISNFQQNDNSFINTNMNLNTNINQIDFDNNNNKYNADNQSGSIYSSDSKVRENIDKFENGNKIPISTELKMLVIITIILFVCIIAFPYIFDLIREIKN